MGFDGRFHKSKRKKTRSCCSLGKEIFEKNRGINTRAGKGGAKAWQMRSLCVVLQSFEWRWPGRLAGFRAMHFFRLRGLFLALGVAMAASWAQARVGETQDQLERRMLHEGLGKVFSMPKNASERERERLEKENPLSGLRSYFPEGAKEVVYWKTSVKQRINADEGWRLYVVYYRGVVVLEGYRRVGTKLSEFEINAILQRNRPGDTPWSKVPKDAVKESALGYGYELTKAEADFLRAKVQGDLLLIYNTKFDMLLFEKRKEQNERDREQDRETQQKKLPDSIEGF
ncbi:hypothetical protein [Geminisphaera colitermitum]|uniref:hypothetical protein n=1 Tax=Geminisphaera colitermitum TaxID=1148786 RepID=UPI0012FEEEE8|nr:hypothetical protein [Geminisphaera colitermitum]